jgi:hypothetical protein
MGILIRLKPKDAFIKKKLKEEDKDWPGEFEKDYKPNR